MNNKKNMNHQRLSGNIPNQPKIMTRRQGFDHTPLIQGGTPKLASSPNGTAIIKNREIISTITGTATTGSIPAGSGGSVIGWDTSPWSFYSGTWATNVGNAYDKYRIKKLKFYFQPTLPVTSSGAVAMYYDPDPLDTTPTGYVNASGNFNATTGAIFDPIELTTMSIQTNRMPWYLIGGTDTSATTQELSPGKIVIAWSSIVLSNASATGTTTIGYIWIDYEIELACPTNPVT
jgi:hypothetical protein